MSRSAKSTNQGGLYFSQFAFSSMGEAFRRTKGRDSGITRTNLYYSLPGPSHPGGMAVLGHFLFVGLECDGDADCNRSLGRVLVFDVSDPWRVDVEHPVSELLLDGARGEVDQSAPRGVGGGRPSSIAAARLADGRVIMFVGGRQSGASYGWLYVSLDPGLSTSTVWEYQQPVCTTRDHDDPSCLVDTNDAWSPWYAAENSALITDCSTGVLHLVRLGDNGSLAARNRARIFRLVERVETATGRSWINIDSQARATRSINSHGHGRISLRWGSGIHVTPSGALVLYATQKRPATYPGVFGFYEFAQ